MSDRQGFTGNFLGFMKELQRNKLCCLDFITNGDNGVSVNDKSVVLGQDVGNFSNPAKLSSNREIPLNGNGILFTDVATGPPDIATTIEFLNSTIVIEGCLENGNPSKISINDAINPKHFDIIYEGDKLVFDLNSAGYIQMFSLAGEVRFTQENDDVNTGHKLQVIGTTFIGGDNVTNNNIAWLQIGAGRSDVGSVNLEQGNLTTSPIDGNLEYDGTNLYFTIGGTRKTISLI